MFCVLKDERLDLRILFCSGAVSTVVFGLMGFFIAIGGGSGVPEDLAHNAASDTNRSEFVPGLVESPHLREADLLRFQAEAVGSKMETAERRRVLDAVIKNLKQHYFDHVIAQKIADELRVAERREDYDAITDSAVLANLLTRQIREISHDMHLEVVLWVACVFESA